MELQGEDAIPVHNCKISVANTFCTQGIHNPFLFLQKSRNLVKNKIQTMHFSEVPKKYGIEIILYY